MYVSPACLRAVSESIQLPANGPDSLYWTASVAWSESSTSIPLLLHVLASLIQIMDTLHYSWLRCKPCCRLFFAIDFHSFLYGVKISCQTLETHLSCVIHHSEHQACVSCNIDERKQSFHYYITITVQKIWMQTFALFTVVDNTTQAVFCGVFYFKMSLSVV